jgi:hypothetical protein
VAIDNILSQQYNPIRENFEIRKMFKTLFQAADTSPLYQLKKHYPEIHAKVMCKEMEDCSTFLGKTFKRNCLGLVSRRPQYRNRHALLLHTRVPSMKTRSARRKPRNSNLPSLNTIPEPLPPRKDWPNLRNIFNPHINQSMRPVILIATLLFAYSANAQPKTEAAQPNPNSRTRFRCSKPSAMP